MEENPPDVVLLDLGLPDSTGLDTLHALEDYLHRIPTIVLTGHQDPELSLKCIHIGAQDYLIKGQFDGPLIARAIRYAMERHRLQSELTRERKARQQQQEAMRLEQLGTTGSTSITAQLYGTADLAEASPESFWGFTDQYCSILELALDERAFKVDHHSSDRLRQLAHALGFLKAGPRDVIRLHSEVFKKMLQSVNKSKADIITEEGRVRLLELMGFLCAWYRSRALAGLPLIDSNDSSPPEKKCEIKNKDHPDGSGSPGDTTEDRSTS